jgi:hypothetical protein
MFYSEAISLSRTLILEAYSKIIVACSETIPWSVKLAVLILLLD